MLAEARPRRRGADRGSQGVVRRDDRWSRFLAWSGRGERATVNSYTEKGDRRSPHAPGRV